MAQISTLFWNVWFDTQDGRFGDGTAVQQRLSELIRQHQPDVIGLNEVLAQREGHESKIGALLRQHGYEVHFSPVYEHSDHSVTGNIFATTLKVQNVSHHLQEAVGTKKHRYYAQSQLIEAHVKVGRKTVALFVTHLAAIWPRQWPTHIRQRRMYEQLLAASTGEHIIVGGDFNETKYMLPWLKKSHFTQLTGTILNPTWRWRGRKRRLLHGNLDRILYKQQQGIHLDSFRVLDRQPSDHAPLLARFTIS